MASVGTSPRAFVLQRQKKTPNPHSCRNPSQNDQKVSRLQHKELSEPPALSPPPLPPPAISSLCRTALLPLLEAVRAHQRQRPRLRQGPHDDRLPRERGDGPCDRPGLGRQSLPRPAQVCCDQDVPSGQGHPFLPTTGRSLGDVPFPGKLTSVRGQLTCPGGTIVMEQVRWFSFCR